MSYDNLQTLEVVRDGAVLHVRLDRPDVRNAFNGDLVDELHRVFEQIGRDRDTRVVLLSGNGKSFCAGADLGWMRAQGQLSRDENEAGAVRMAGAFLAIARCAAPVVARIHGHALGGGCGLAAAVDIALCADDTTFGLTEVKLGIVPAVISPFVIQKIGAGRARALFTTGERFDGCEAARIGLVHRAVATAELDELVDATIRQLMSSGPAAVASAKDLIRNIAPLDLETAVPVAARWIAELRATDEAVEGMSAFLEKRKPSWMT